MNKLFPAAAAALALAACSSTPDTPDARAIGQWQSLGNIQNHNIAVSYDTGSLKKQGAAVRIRDRKIVKDTDAENYLDLPRYKTAISEWEIHCANKTYRILSAKYWDGRGEVLAQHDYGGSIRPAAVVAGSPAQSLFEAACR